MREIRVFISSPGDAMNERRRVEQVIGRLNGRFSDAVRVQAILWEEHFYSAHETFQTQIPATSDCDIVVAIFRSRIGTELPPGFPTLPDGTPYPSGTAYEVLTAIHARKASDHPDIYVFRHSGAPSIHLDDPERETNIRDQWERLKAFFDRWFVSPDGHWTAAFHPFSDTDDFARQVEKALSQWIETHLLGEHRATWPIELKSSPFRGLAVFGARHADVFFGRTREIEDGVDMLRSLAGSPEHLPFLLLTGPSGAGKSSLARGGLLPRLVKAGVVDEVDVWRTITLRPLEVGHDPLLTLATRAFDGADDIPLEEEGRPVALPELANGDFPTPTALAERLRSAADPADPLVSVLSDIGQAEAERLGSARPATARLLLVIDQMDDLFGADIDDATRARFARLLAALLASGKVWIVATLRSDFYEAMLRDNDFSSLKAAGTTLDVASPSLGALEDTIRLPAVAADFDYEARLRPDGSREYLDDRIIADAGGADMLPAVQFTLDRLFDRREVIDGRVTLTHAAYEVMNGVNGAIASQAAEALAGFGSRRRNTLGRLLRLMVTETAGTDGTRRRAILPASYAKLTATPDLAAMTDRLIAARILLAEKGDAPDGEDGARVHLAHQRVIDAWPEAKSIVDDSAFFLRVGREVAESEATWRRAGRRGDLLLPRGIRLSEAERLLRDYREEVPDSSALFIRASTWRARRALAFSVAAATIFAAIAALAGLMSFEAQRQTREAEHQRAQAERNFDAARQAVDGLVFDVAQGLSATVGLRVETTRKILDTARLSVDRLTETAPDNPLLLRSRMAMLRGFSMTYLHAGETRSAVEAAEGSLDIARRLAARPGDNPSAQDDLAASFNNLGEIQFQTGDNKTALDAFESGLNVARRLAADHPDILAAHHDISINLDGIGKLRLRMGDSASALAAFEESLAIRRGLQGQGPDSVVFRRAMSVSLYQIGEVKIVKGDRAGALKAYQESLDICRKLVAEDPDNGELRSWVAAGLDRIGDLHLSAGDRTGAADAFQESLSIRRKLLALDPGSMPTRRELALSLDRLGDVETQLGNSTAALAFYIEGLENRRKYVTQDAANIVALRDLTLSLTRVGDLRHQSGDTADAKAAFEECSGIARRIVDLDPESTEAQRDLSISLERVGDIRLVTGDQMGAQTAHRESLAIRRKLVEHNPDSADANRDVAVSLIRVGDVEQKAGNAATALADFQESLGISRKFSSKMPENVKLRDDVAVALQRIGGIQLQLGNAAMANEALEEALAITQEELAAAPANVEVLRTHYISLSLNGDALHLRGEFTKALETYQKTLELARKLSSIDPSNGEARADIAAILSKIAVVKVQSGDESGAFGAIEEAIDNSGGTIAGVTDDPEIQQLRASKYLSTGDALASAGNSKDALDAYEKSLELQRELLKRGPAPADQQRDLSILLDKIGDILSSTGDSDGARRAFSEALAISRQILAADPDNPTAQSDVAFDLDRLGDQWEGAGDIDSALRLFQESLSIRRKLAGNESPGSETQRDMSISLGKIGDIWREQGNTDGALKAFQESLEISRKAMADNPNSPEAGRDLGISLDRIGDLQQSAGDIDGALSIFQESLNIRRKLAGNESPGPEALRDLSISLGKIGDIWREQGNTDNALKAFQESLEISRKLMADDPNSRDARRDFAIDLSRVGDLRMATGEADAALDFYQRSRDIHRALAKEAPDDLDVQRDVSVAASKVGDAQVALDDTDGAIEAYTEDLAFARRYADGNRESIEAQRDVVNSLIGLGNAQLDAGDNAKALAAFEDCLDLRRTMNEKWPDNADAQEEYTTLLANISYYRLFARRFTDAEASAREALRRDPNKSSAKVHLAHALLLEGKTGEAEAIYLGNRGLMLDGVTWEESVTTTFAQLRDAGISVPDMDRIESQLRAPSQ